MSSTTTARTPRSVESISSRLSVGDRVSPKLSPGLIGVVIDVDHEAGSVRFTLDKLTVSCPLSQVTCR